MKSFRILRIVIWCLAAVVATWMFIVGSELPSRPAIATNASFYLEAGRVVGQRSVISTKANRRKSIAIPLRLLSCRPKAAFNQKPAFIKDGMCDRNYVRVDTLQVTQDIEMQRTCPYAVCATIA